MFSISAYAEIATIIGTLLTGASVWLAYRRPHEKDPPYSTELDSGSTTVGDAVGTDPREPVRLVAKTSLEVFDLTFRWGLDDIDKPSYDEAFSRINHAKATELDATARVREINDRADLFTARFGERLAHFARLAITWSADVHPLVFALATLPATHRKDRPMHPFNRLPLEHQFVSRSQLLRTLVQHDRVSFFLSLLSAAAENQEFKLRQLQSRTKITG